eukprot:TRINITY_DN15497_c0_g1_i1.p1 TRINITY_DN15497_c0_g1~~TRINITY_DN15497_c0_g1_i1.p1  ORF type:complete len:162 (-),score=25.85 TRINITY_DN15497_c0_g1_i1:205-624(-)
MKKTTAVDDVDFSRWICIYPVYIDSKKTCQEGRRIPKNKSVDNPKPSEIADVCRQMGFQCIIEAEKCYPRNFLLKGRVRVELKTGDGNPINPNIPNRRTLMLKAAAAIPKLPRQQVQLEVGASTKPTKKPKKVNPKNIV